MTDGVPRRAYVALGANLPWHDGQSLQTPDQTLRRAIHALALLPGVLSVRASSLWTSEPVDAEGPPFVNAAAEVLTERSADQLLSQLLEIEAHHGRQRPTAIAPSDSPAPGQSDRRLTPSPARSLDLDLIWMEGVQSQTPALQLPHPRASARAFVLKPLMELNPSLRLAGPDLVGPGPSTDHLSTLDGLLARLPADVQAATRRLEGC